MPRYDYRCESGHKYERQEPFGSPVEQDCIKCGKPARRVLTPPKMVFKGSGWYKTDSRVRNGGNGGDSSGSESKASSSSD